MLRTEHEFVLPQGFLDSEGDLHREGVMRLATAADEIIPLKDPRVQKNPAYLVIILLSRVVTRLGSVSSINPSIIEGLFVADLAFLQDLYNRINHPAFENLEEDEDGLLLDEGQGKGGYSGNGMTPRAR